MPITIPNHVPIKKVYVEMVRQICVFSVLKINFVIFYKEL